MRDRLWCLCRRTVASSAPRSRMQTCSVSAAVADGVDVLGVDVLGGGSPRSRWRRPGPCQRRLDRAEHAQRRDPDEGVDAQPDCGDACPRLHRSSGVCAARRMMGSRCRGRSRRARRRQRRTAPAAVPFAGAATCLPRPPSARLHRKRLPVIPSTSASEGRVSRSRPLIRFDRRRRSPTPSGSVTRSTSGPRRTDILAAALPGAAGIAGFTLIGAFAGYRQAKAVQRALLAPVPTSILL